MPKPNSWMSADSDYDSGGNGLFGSVASEDMSFWKRHFGVVYDNENDWNEKYNNDASSGSFKEWYDNATPDERAAAIRYTTGSYETINDYLRGDNLSNAPQWVKDVVRNVDKAMQKFDLKSAITVFRGGSNKLIGGASTLEQINAMKGAIVRDKGITSTAVTKEASWISDSKMGYEIVYPKGRGRGIFIDPVSANHGESEFMAARNTRYEVLGGYTDSDGRVICRLKAVYPRRSRK